MNGIEWRRRTKTQIHIYPFAQPHPLVRISMFVHIEWATKNRMLVKHLKSFQFSNFIKLFNSALQSKRSSLPFVSPTHTLTELLRSRLRFSTSLLALQHGYWDERIIPNFRSFAFFLLDSFLWFVWFIANWLECKKEIDKFNEKYGEKSSFCALVYCIVRKYRKSEFMLSKYFECVIQNYSREEKETKANVGIWFEPHKNVIQLTDTLIMWVWVCVCGFVWYEQRWVQHSGCVYQQHEAGKAFETLSLYIICH